MTKGLAIQSNKVAFFSCRPDLLRTRVTAVAVLSSQFPGGTVATLDAARHGGRPSADVGKCVPPDEGILMLVDLFSQIILEEGSGPEIAV